MNLSAVIAGIAHKKLVAVDLPGAASGINMSLTGYPP